MAKDASYLLPTIPYLRGPCMLKLERRAPPPVVSLGLRARMDWGAHPEAPYVYTFFAGVLAVLFRPPASAVPVVAACGCECQCDCAGTGQWGARALLVSGAAALLLAQGLVFGGYLFVCNRQVKIGRRPAPRLVGDHPRTLPILH